MPEHGAYKDSKKLERQMASLYVLSTGRQQCAPGYGWGPGVRDHYLLHLILSGTGTYTVGGAVYALSAGDSFLIYPNTPVHYCADKEEPWEYIWVGFDGLDAPRHMERTVFSADAPVRRQWHAEALAPLLEDIYRAYGTSPAARLAMAGRLYLLLAFLTEQGAAGGGGEREESAASIAVEYIASHYAQPMTMEELARHLSVSQSSLYRQFVRRYGISPKRFLMEYRMDRACELLSEGNYSVQEVSNSVGFEDPFYFSRAFRESKGVSPKQYAAEHRRRR